jgi:hypothetical protein
MAAMRGSWLEWNLVERMAKKKVEWRVVKRDMSLDVQ